MENNGRLYLQLRTLNLVEASLRLLGQFDTMTS